MSDLVHFMIVPERSGYGYAACCRWTPKRAGIHASMLARVVTCKGCKRTKAWKAAYVAQKIGGNDE